jgi:hypothetical protein
MKESLQRKPNGDLSRSFVVTRDERDDRRATNRRFVLFLLKGFGAVIGAVVVVVVGHALAPGLF